MGKAELMQEMIDKQRQLPNELKEKLNNITFINLLISIGFMLYMMVVNLLYINETMEVFTLSTKTTAFIFAVLDILLFEVSYRKDNIYLALHAIEFLVLCLFILSIPYIYVYLNPIVKSILMLSPVYFSIYYVGKAICIHFFEANNYLNNLSDIPELLQEDKEGYLEDEDSNLS